MFISHPQIYLDSMDRKYGGTLFKTPWEGTTTKLSAFNDLLKADHARPTLVFCNFKQEMDYVAGVAKALGYNVYFIRGGMGAAARKRSISESAKLCVEGRPVLMICQIVAGNCGLNLQHLTRVIFYTQHWNPSVMDQAMARSYRYGQQKEVAIQHLVIGSQELYNIDRCMLAKHLVKRGLVSTLNPALEFAFCPKFAVPRDEEILEPIDFKVGR
jgi:SNF2 family DNA or RNA helicase